MLYILAAYCMHTKNFGYAYRLHTLKIRLPGSTAICLLPEKTDMMNNLILNITDKLAFFTFSAIVEKGVIKIWFSETGSKQERLVCKRRIVHTNFESISLNDGHGKLRIEVTMDGQHIKKCFTI